MSRFDDFFKDTPPPESDAHTIKSVQTALRNNRENNRSWVDRWGNWSSLAWATSAASILAVGSYMALRSMEGPNEEFSLLSFEEVVAPDDFFIVAEENLDFDLLDHLEILEEMEDV